MSVFDDASSSILEGFTTSSNKYEILGILPSASTEEIKLAYRRCALLYHPDRHEERFHARAAAIFQKVASAYQTLSDPTRRRRYDQALARGIELEDDEVEDPISLREILMAIQTQEHAFSDRSLQQLEQALADAVRGNLISDLSEQIVETLPIRNAPSGTVHEGIFQSGAIVLTTLRLLFPYCTKKETRSGNVRTIQRFLYMPAIPLPTVQQLWVVDVKRRSSRIQLSLQVEERIFDSLMKTRNIGKILLMCRLWGISVKTAERFSKTLDRRLMIWWLPILGALGSGIFFWMFWTGATGAAVITWCMLAGVGYFRYRIRHRLPTMTEQLNRINSTQDSRNENKRARSPAGLSGETG